MLVEIRSFSKLLVHAGKENPVILFSQVLRLKRDSAEGGKRNHQQLSEYVISQGEVCIQVSYIIPTVNLP